MNRSSSQGRARTVRLSPPVLRSLRRTLGPGTRIAGAFTAQAPRPAEQVLYGIGAAVVIVLLPVLLSVMPPWLDVVLLGAAALAVVVLWRRLHRVVVVLAADGVLVYRAWRFPYANPRELLGEVPYDAELDPREGRFLSRITLLDRHWWTSGANVELIARVAERRR